MFGEDESNDKDAGLTKKHKALVWEAGVGDNVCFYEPATVLVGAVVTKCNKNSARCAVGAIGSHSNTRNKTVPWAKLHPAPTFDLHRSYSINDKVLVLFIDEEEHLLTWYEAEITGYTPDKLWYRVEYEMEPENDWVSCTNIYPPLNN